jgi:hypothetical protein
LEHGKLAVRYAHRDLVNKRIKKHDCVNSITTLANAYHMIGIIHGVIGNYQDAMNAHKRAITFLRKYGSSAHQNLAVELTNSYKKA